MADQIACDRCPGTMAYDGRISLPPQTNYKCERCGHSRWIADRPSPYNPRPAMSVEQPQAQQQQQSQPDKDSEK